MGYLEKLPDNCPIEKADDIFVDLAYRVVPCENPTIEHFLSNAALGIPPTPIADLCRHASCSLFKKKSVAIDISRKLPKARFTSTYLSWCKIDIGNGKSYINKKKHVDFWPYETFEPTSVILKTEKI